MNTKKRAEEEVKKWVVPGSKPGREWTVQKHKKYGLSCNCPSWIYRLKNGQRGCKHTRQIFELIGGVQTHF